MESTNKKILLTGISNYHLKVLGKFLLKFSGLKISKPEFNSAGLFKNDVEYTSLLTDFGNEVRTIFQQNDIIIQTSRNLPGECMEILIGECDKILYLSTSQPLKFHLNKYLRKNPLKWYKSKPEAPLDLIFYVTDSEITESTYYLDLIGQSGKPYLHGKLEEMIYDNGNDVGFNPEFARKALQFAVPGSEPSLKNLTQYAKRLNTKHIELLKVDMYKKIPNLAQIRNQVRGDYYGNI